MGLGQPVYLKVRDIVAFEKALDALGVCKHDRRGIERSESYRGIPVVVSADVPTNKAIFMQNGEAHVWDLPEVRP